MEFIRKIANYFAQHWLRLIIGLTVIAFIVAVIARIIAPPAPTVNAPRLRTTEQLSGPVEVTYTGDRSLPTSLPLHRGSNFLPSSQLARTLAQRLNLTLHPQVPNLYTDPDLTTTMSQPAGSDAVEYSRLASSGDVVSLETARSLALAFLEQAGYPVNELSLREEQTNYYVSSLEELIETTADKATVIEFFFTRTLSGHPAVLDSVPINSMRLLVTSKGVRNASLISLFYSTESQGSVALLDFDSVLKNVSEGEFLILGTLDVIDPQQQGNKPKKLQLDSLEVEYRFDLTQELFLPFVRFSGEATLENGSVVPIRLITPAIETAPAP